MEKVAKISVLIPPEEAAQFDEYCQREGFKKSTLILKLIREHMSQNQVDGVKSKMVATKKGRK